MSRSFTALLTGLLLVALGVEQAQAQQANRPRLGFGFNTMLNTSDGLGVGLHMRAARPVNADLSLALEAGFAGFILEGRDDASYLFTPQASVIVTMDARGSRTPYFLGGFGAALPLEKDSAESGPTLHLGFGWVQGLRDTVLYYEVDPSLLVGKTDVSFFVPLRVGVIF